MIRYYFEPKSENYSFHKHRLSRPHADAAIVSSAHRMILTWPPIMSDRPLPSSFDGNE